MASPPMLASAALVCFKLEWKGKRKLQVAEGDQPPLVRSELE